MSTFLAVRKHGGRILLAALVVTASASFFWYRNVQQKKDPGAAPPSAPVAASSAQMVTRDFRHVETQLNETVWILEAALAEVFEETARLQRVKITYYGEEKDPVVVTGRRGRVDLGSWNAVLFGSVRVVGRDGSVLKTRRLEWDSKSEVLTAPWSVRVRSGRVDLRGIRLTADLKKNKATVEGRVNTVIRPPSGFLEPAT